MSGGYDPNQTDQNSRLIQVQLATHRRLWTDPQLWPRSAGSWPGYLFTDPPPQSPGRALRHGARHRRARPGRVLPHRVDHPKVQGLDGAIASFVEYLYALA